MNKNESSVTFVVPGDLHLTEPGLDNHRAAHRVVDQVNAWIRPDFVQFIGDNVQDATEAQFRLFDELHGRLEVPHFALVGDHDVKGDPGAEGFRAHVGPTYGSTVLGGVRFIRLDTQQAKPLGISPEQVGWFRGEVDEATAAGERVVVFQHNYPYQIWEDFAGPGVDDWRGIVQSRRVAAIVCGHTHYLQFANDGRNPLVATQSIGDPEGGPPGYLVGHVEGDDLGIAFRAVEEAGPLVLITRPCELILATGPAHVVSGRDRVLVRTWSESPVVGVVARVDECGPFPLESDGPGRWSAPLEARRLLKGEHTLVVEATDAGGCRGRHAIEFLVDPTGRFTAVPGVRPRVTTTGFC